MTEELKTKWQLKAENRFSDKSEKELAESDEKKCKKIIENEIKTHVNFQNIQALQVITSSENDHRLWYWNVMQRKYHKFKDSCESVQRDAATHNPINDRYALDNGNPKPGYIKVYYKDDDGKIWSAYELDIPELIHFQANEISAYPKNSTKNKIRETDKEYVAKLLFEMDETELEQFLSPLDILCIKKYGSVSSTNKFLPADTSIHHRVDGFLSLVDCSEHKNFYGCHKGSVQEIFEKLKEKYKC